MADKSRFSIKHLQIDKATTTMVIFIAVSTCVLVFSLLASKALLSQRSYYARVISKKTDAKKKLEANVKAKEALVTSYKQFVAQPQNVLGGNPNGQGQNDGDNARIVLDALPSKYDFPALATSLEKLLGDPKIGVKLVAFGGSDDELNQSALEDAAPTPVEIPLSLTISGSYQSTQSAINAIERSIRPIHILTLSLGGTDATMNVSLTAKTYYQPEKKININVETIR